MMNERWCGLVCLLALVAGTAAQSFGEDVTAEAGIADPLRDLQSAAVENRYAAWGHWGADPTRYSTWGSHSNRLIPVYTFGITLDGFKDEASPYRDAAALEALYGRLPEGTLNPTAAYFDQTGIYALQKQAFEQGKKYVILFVFDGMDWQTTHAAATYANGQVAYNEGRGTGLGFLDYRGTETDYGFVVTSPQNKGTDSDVDAQVLVFDQDLKYGGYDWQRGGATPWATPEEPTYLLGQSTEQPHTYNDSAATASALTSGTKTYYGSINVDPQGQQTVPIARDVQATREMSVGVVTSVPISHATPAAAYANNVSRDDFQDLARDLLGLSSVAHRQALAGVDVLLGAGAGDVDEKSRDQGANFVPGNRYLTAADRERIDVDHGGEYVAVERVAGVSGSEALQAATQRAIDEGKRLFGMFGVGQTDGSPKGSHLPYRTADGRYDPTPGGYGKPDDYDGGDLKENPTLAEMTTAALAVLEQNPHGFWLMVEAGDVDWANHENNLDASIGAVISGDDAFRAVVEWVERHDAWDDTAVIVTADHGHYLNLRDPSVLTRP